MSKVKVPAGMVSGECSIPACRQPLSCVLSDMVKERKSAHVSSLKIPTPALRAPLIRPNHLSSPTS